MARGFIIRIEKLILLTLCMASAAWAVPSQPSVVTVNGRRVLVSKRLPNNTLAAPAPYIIKGIDWNPATIAPANGPDPSLGGASVPYGFFFDGSWRSGLQGHDLMNLWIKDQIPQYLTDIPLMAQMNVNTVRVYSDFGTNPAVYQQVLDAFYNNGIMVIMSVVGSRADIDSGQYLNAVAICKNHPAILMWSVGNEWNFNTLYGYPDAPSGTAAVNNAAAQIKAADPNHPVSSSLGDKFALNPTGPCGPDAVGSDIPTIVSAAPNVDVWAMNVYRGPSFGTLFRQWAGVSAKPLYLSEFGTDSYATTQYTKPFYNAAGCVFDGRALVSAGAENQAVQSTFDVGLWNEIAKNLSATDPQKTSVGGVVFQFNDTLWKVGNYNVNLGGLIANYNGPDNIPGTADDDHSYDSYNPDGFELSGGLPDNVANEEYFGLVKHDRTPKSAYQTLKTAYLNQPPSVSACTPAVAPCPSQTVLVTSTPTLAGTATDDGLPTPPGSLTYQWSMLSGPIAAVISNPTQLTTAVHVSSPGTYVFQLTAQDGQMVGLSSVTVQVQGIGRLDLTKSANSSTAKPGDTITFTIQYQNNGNGMAVNSTISDIVPAGTTLVSGSILNGGTLTNGTVQWSLGDVAAGTQGIVSFQVMVQ